MTAEDVIRGFRENAPEGAKRAAYANELFQEAIRLGMVLNNQYHTPEEIREVMGRLTGKEIAPGFRLFPPFYTDFGLPSANFHYTMAYNSCKSSGINSKLEEPI